MLEKLKLVEARYLEMAERAAQPDFYNDPKAASQLLKEQRQLEPIITAYRSYRRTQAEQEDLRAMLSEGLEPEMKALCQEEFSENKKKLEALEQELKILLLPRDPNDDKSVIMEIRGGVGGEESALFAHSLYRMYTMYAEAKHWTVTLLNYNETELGGVKEADFEIQGAGAYSRLKFESGVHRVQRVPETESGGRVHTSTATVAVLPEMEQAEVDIRPEDIEMQVYRSSGAGGQHINKTSSAVRLIHKPSGIVVACQEERSQVQNREKCMQTLASKLYQIEQERIESAVTSERRSQVGTGMRNERIRTYNFPQGRVTDHRIGLTLYKIDSIMDGALDELIDALVTADQAEKLQSSQRYVMSLDKLHERPIPSAADLRTAAQHFAVCFVHKENAGASEMTTTERAVRKSTSLILCAHFCAFPRPRTEFAVWVLSQICDNLSVSLRLTASLPLLSLRDISP